MHSPKLARKKPRRRTGEPSRRTSRPSLYGAQGRIDGSEQQRKDCRDDDQPQAIRFGEVGAAILMSSLCSQLFGVGPWDPLTYVSTR